ncbi:hypothetical protein I551_5877 [Mycobacterium ulcerans str. Harvey]|uniref:Uncharacterized protein n=1 Tax=Mycobacterium ulcerans str. Harvey TaxID=1299332 RepID=A0ABN0QSF8_MYCUL|nr:hypothetical protein I551_5877 [Mycobacterium ulcerans str. Harvey]
MGPECRHGLSGERSSWLLFVVGLELPVPTVSVLPVSSVPEVFDRWSAGERSELIGSEFLDVLASCQTEGPRGRRYSLMALWRSRFWPLPRGCAAMLVCHMGGHRFR